MLSILNGAIMSAIRNPNADLGDFLTQIVCSCTEIIKADNRIFEWTFLIFGIERH